MNVIFLTMSQNTDVTTRGCYSDLLRKFRDEGHQVYVVYPSERREHKQTNLRHENGIYLLQVKTLNLQKTSVIEKGLGQVSVEWLYKNAIKRNLKGINFDIILYSTPPITFVNVVKFLKKKNPRAISYLLLKDIFPQNALDLGMLGTTGIKGILYRYFRNKERKLYQLSDYIGCMSPANVKYVIEHNPEVETSKVEEAPNSYEITPMADFPVSEKEAIKTKYGLPLDKPIVLYGGSLGKPQGIPFLIECLNANKDRKDCHFLIIGSGTEAGLLSSWIDDNHPSNVTVFPAMPNDEYHRVVRSSDIGMVFLDDRFTIPNYPSRTLDYMMYGLPMLIATDVVCDMGPIAEKEGYGCWCRSNNVVGFTDTLNKLLNSDLKGMGVKSRECLEKLYPIEKTYNAIIQHCK